jgi:YD repeat-containing protein
MATMQGENVGYNEVDVSQTGNGKSIYRYFGSDLWSGNNTDVCVRSLNQSSVCDLAIPNWPYAPLPFEFMRGELKYEGHFNEGGQVLKESYYYPVFAMDPLTTPGHITGQARGGIYSYTEYQLQTARKLQDKVTTTSYDPANGNSLTTTETTYYNSLFHHSPTRKVSTTSTGDSLATNIKYAMDFRIPSCDAIPDSLAVYNAAVHADSAAMYSSLYGCSPQTDDAANCRWASFKSFRLQMAQDRINFINYRRRNYTDPGNVLSACYLAKEALADTLLRPVLKLQDEFRNPEVEVSSFKNGSLLHAAYTKYDTSLNPLGFVYPSRSKIINLQTPSSTFTNATVSGNTIARDNRYTDEATYAFSNGHPATVTAHDGVASSYIWDYSNTEPVAKATNATADQIAFTSFEADGKGGWTFSGTPATDAPALTGAKDYTLNGSNNITKAGLSSSKSFVVSYWSKTGSAMVNSAVGTLLASANGWNYYEHRLAAGITSVTVSGSVKIDELRLYPSDAQMSSYTYSPLVGMTTSADANGRISFYQYDGLGRLTAIKDQDGNIIKTIQYHYKGEVLP